MTVQIRQSGNGARCSTPSRVQSCGERLHGTVVEARLDAPERLALDVKLPEGARLRPAVAKDPIPGDPPLSLEIVRGDDTPV